MDLEAAALVAALVEVDLAEVTAVASAEDLAVVDLEAPVVSTVDRVDLIIADRALDTVIIIARAFMAVGDGDPVITDMVEADALAVFWAL